MCRKCFLALLIVLTSASLFSEAKSNKVALVSGNGDYGEIPKTEKDAASD